MLNKRTPRANMLILMSSIISEPRKLVFSLHIILCGVQFLCYHYLLDQLRLSLSNTHTQKTCTLADVLVTVHVNVHVHGDVNFQN